MDNAGSGIQALNDLCSMFRRGARGERVGGLGCPTVDGALENYRPILDRLSFGRRASRRDTWDGDSSGSGS